MNEKGKLIKGGYSVEVVTSDGKKVLWGVVDDHVVEDENDHGEIELRGFIIISSAKTRRGLVEKG